MDLLIGSYALSDGAILVTNDRALGRLPSLIIEDGIKGPG